MHPQRYQERQYQDYYGHAANSGFNYRGPCAPNPHPLSWPRGTHPPQANYHGNGSYGNGPDWGFNDSHGDMNFNAPNRRFQMSSGPPVNNLTINRSFHQAQTQQFQQSSFQSRFYHDRSSYHCQELQWNQAGQADRFMPRARYLDHAQNPTYTPDYVSDRDSYEDLEFSQGHLRAEERNINLVQINLIPHRKRKHTKRCAVQPRQKDLNPSRTNVIGQSKVIEQSLSRNKTATSPTMTSSPPGSNLPKSAAVSSAANQKSPSSVDISPHIASQELTKTSTSSSNVPMGINKPSPKSKTHSQAVPSTPAQQQSSPVDSAQQRLQKQQSSQKDVPVSNNHTPDITTKNAVSVPEKKTLPRIRLKLLAKDNMQNFEQNSECSDCNPPIMSVPPSVKTHRAVAVVPPISKQTIEGDKLKGGDDHAPFPIKDIQSLANGKEAEEAVVGTDCATATKTLSGIMSSEVDSRPEDDAILNNPSPENKDISKHESSGDKKKKCNDHVPLIMKKEDIQSHTNEKNDALVVTDCASASKTLTSVMSSEVDCHPEDNAICLNAKSLNNSSSKSKDISKDESSGDKRKGCNDHVPLLIKKDNQTLDNNKKEKKESVVDTDCVTATNTLSGLTPSEVACHLEDGAISSDSKLLNNSFCENKDISKDESSGDKRKRCNDHFPLLIKKDIQSLGNEKEEALVDTGCTSTKTLPGDTSPEVDCRPEDNAMDNDANCSNTKPLNNSFCENKDISKDESSGDKKKGCNDHVTQTLLIKKDIQSLADKKEKTEVLVDTDCLTATKILSGETLSEVGRHPAKPLNNSSCENKDISKDESSGDKRKGCDDHIPLLIKKDIQSLADEKEKREALVDTDCSTATKTLSGETLSEVGYRLEDNTICSNTNPLNNLALEDNDESSDDKMNNHVPLLIKDIRSLANEKGKEEAVVDIDRATATKTLPDVTSSVVGGRWEDAICSNSKPINNLSLENNDISEDESSGNKRKRCNDHTPLLVKDIPSLVNEEETEEAVVDMDGETATKTLPGVTSSEVGYHIKDDAICANSKPLNNPSSENKNISKHESSGQLSEPFFFGMPVMTFSLRMLRELVLGLDLKKDEGKTSESGVTKVAPDCVRAILDLYWGGNYENYVATELGGTFANVLKEAAEFDTDKDMMVFDAMKVEDLKQLYQKGCILTNCFDGDVDKSSWRNKNDESLDIDKELADVHFTRQVYGSLYCQNKSLEQCSDIHHLDNEDSVPKEDTQLPFLPNVAKSDIVSLNSENNTEMAMKPEYVTVDSHADLNQNMSTSENHRQEDSSTGHKEDLFLQIQVENLNGYGHQNQAPTDPLNDTEHKTLQRCQNKIPRHCSRRGSDFSGDAINLDHNSKDSNGKTYLTEKICTLPVEQVNLLEKHCTKSPCEVIPRVKLTQDGQSSEADKVDSKNKLQDLICSGHYGPSSPILIYEHSSESDEDSLDDSMLAMQLTVLSADELRALSVDFFAHCGNNADMAYSPISVSSEDDSELDSVHTCQTDGETSHITKQNKIPTLEGEEVPSIHSNNKALNILMAEVTKKRNKHMASSAGKQPTSLPKDGRKRKFPQERYPKNDQQHPSKSFLSPPMKKVRVKSLRDFDNSKGLAVTEVMKTNQNNHMANSEGSEPTSPPKDSKKRKCLQEWPPPSVQHPSQSCLSPPLKKSRVKPHRDFGHLDGKSSKTYPQRSRADVIEHPKNKMKKVNAVSVSSPSRDNVLNRTGSTQSLEKSSKLKGDQKVSVKEANGKTQHYTKTNRNMSVAVVTKALYNTSQGGSTVKPCTTRESVLNQTGSLKSPEKSFGVEKKRKHVTFNLDGAHEVSLKKAYGKTLYYTESNGNLAVADLRKTLDNKIQEDNTVSHNTSKDIVWNQTGSSNSPEMSKFSKVEKKRKPVKLKLDGAHKVNSKVNGKTLHYTESNCNLAVADLTKMLDNTIQGDNTVSHNTNVWNRRGNSKSPEMAKSSGVEKRKHVRFKLDGVQKVSLKEANGQTFESNGNLEVAGVTKTLDNKIEGDNTVSHNTNVLNRRGNSKSPKMPNSAGVEKRKHVRFKLDGAHGVSPKTNGKTFYYTKTNGNLAVADIVGDSTVNHGTAMDDIWNQTGSSKSPEMPKPIGGHKKTKHVRFNLDEVQKDHLKEANTKTQYYTESDSNLPHLHRILHSHDKPSARNKIKQSWEHSFVPTPIRFRRRSGSESEDKEKEVPEKPVEQHQKSCGEEKQRPCWKSSKNKLPQQPSSETKPQKCTHRSLSLSELRMKAERMGNSSKSPQDKVNMALHVMKMYKQGQKKM